MHRLRPSLFHVDLSESPIPHSLRQLRELQAAKATISPWSLYCSSYHAVESLAPDPYQLYTIRVLFYRNSVFLGLQALWSLYIHLLSLVPGTLQAFIQGLRFSVPSCHPLRLAIVEIFDRVLTLRFLRHQESLLYGQGSSGSSISKTASLTVRCPLFWNSRRRVRLILATCLHGWIWIYLVG